MAARIGLVLLTLGLAGFQSSAQGSEFYTAAVVEYAAFHVQPGSREDPAAILEKNAINHMYFMEQAAAKGADIIVFPECGLTGIHLPSSRQELRPYVTEIPEPGRANPCLDASLNVSQVLRELSCGARRHKIYTVVNLPEVAPCSPPGDGGSSCPSDGFFIFNTNIAFDRHGNLIARYRKYNLFVEPGFNFAPTAEHSMFDTDFGVRFGMFICFDILFHEPAVAMVTKHNLTDIVYSTAWFSELPFLTAVQTQAEWAYAMDTNLLASGYNNPKNKNTGSGIYAGREGAITSVMAFDEMNKMLVAKVRKRSRSNSVSPVSGEHQVRARREATELREGISAEDDVTAPPSQKTFSHQASKSFINYLLQHVRKKDTEKQSECNRNSKDDARSIAKRDVMTASAKEVQERNPHQAIKHQSKGNSNLHLFNTALLNLTKVNDTGNHTESVFLCHLRLCCHFTVSATQVQAHSHSDNTMPPEEFYRVGVFDGSKTDNYQTCLVTKCAGRDVGSCENVDYSSLHTHVIFNTIIVEGNFKKNGNVKLEDSHIVSGSFSEVMNGDHITMRNIIRIHNLTTISLHVDSFSKENTENMGKYGHLNFFKDDLSLYNTVLVGAINVNKNLSVCQGNLCCEFYIGTGATSPPLNNGLLVSSDGYYFRVGVFGGVRTFLGTIKAGLQVCALFACTGEALDTCASLKNQTSGRARTDEGSMIPETLDGNNSPLVDTESTNGKFVLEKIEIRGSFDEGNLIMPNTLTSQILPFGSDKFEFSLGREQSLNKDTNKTIVVMETTNRYIDDVLTFGVLARDFSKDNDWHRALYQLLLNN